MDSSRDTYQRTVFSVLDLFGAIGGIFGLLQTNTNQLRISTISIKLLFFYYYIFT